MSELYWEREVSLVSTVYQHENQEPPGLYQWTNSIFPSASFVNSSTHHYIPTGTITM